MVRSNIMLKHGILGLLNYGDMTGYEIMTLFRDSLQYFWSANTSQIYRELGTLKDNGYATVTVVPQEGKPDKKIFSITEKGKEELKLWLRDSDYGNQNTPLCMKTFFASELPRCENIVHFHEIIVRCDEELKRYVAIREVISAYQGMVSNPDAVKYWEMTVDYGMRYLQMLKDWSENNIRILGEVK